ncbi:MAG: S1 family peptidase, partial [Chloroflexota bacterium]
MTQQALSQGIDAIRAGHIEEGARLLRIALKSEEVRGSMRALGWNWLAQTLTDPQDKLRCYNEALAADPQNEYARQHIEALLGQGLPPSAGASKAAPAPPSNVPEQQQTRRQPDVEVPPAQPSAPNIEQGQRAQAVDYNNYSPSQQQKPASQQSPQSFQQDPNAIYRTVGILDGPNGRGTGFFVTRNGLVATTRYVVGGARTITYELARGQRGSGQVVRSIPTLDLTLIHTGVTVRQTLPIISTPEIPDDAPLTAITHYGRVINGHKRATRSLIKQGWFPTTIDQLADSGGNPVFNKQNLLVGMLTHNANRTAPYVFGVSIHTIYEVVER